jgi:hypothetical protein
MVSKRISQKSTPFKLMVAGRWLQGHPGTRVLDGATWLDGFYSHLEDDLHPVDREYLEQLATWHEQKGGQLT